MSRIILRNESLTLNLFRAGHRVVPDRHRRKAVHGGRRLIIDQREEFHGGRGEALNVRHKVKRDRYRHDRKRSTSSQPFRERASSGSRST